MPSHGVEAARALKEAGCAILFLAGRADDLEAPMREAGIDAFLHQGCDLISLLGEGLGSHCRGAQRSFLTLGGHILVLRSINA